MKVRTDELVWEKARVSVSLCACVQAGVRICEGAQVCSKSALVRNPSLKLENAPCLCLHVNCV